jgi:hypothetical protein
VSNPFVTGASSIVVVEQGDGSLLQRERPVLSVGGALLIAVAGGAGLALMVRGGADNSWLGWVVQEMLGYFAIGMVCLGIGAAAVDFGWSELRVTDEGATLSRRVLVFRLGKKLPRPVEVAAPGNGLEIRHGSVRHTFASRLNSIDSSHFVNLIIGKFPALAQETR